ncbi:unnamed protein product [Orchesella dallaii]|uniref:Uncharacterized protein n=1 Tax=Orchesella dallaii TaxID=48710 RepID=A0ABP1RB55_9HEXA
MNDQDERQKRTDMTGKKNVVVPKKVLSAFMLMFMWLISGGGQVGKLTTFVINNVQCRGPALNIVNKQQDDPFFIKKIQWYLNPHVKWDELVKEEWSKQNLEENSDLYRNKKEEKIKGSSLNDFHDGNKHVWFFVTTLILLCIIVVAAAAVVYLQKRKKEQGTAIAEEAAETRQPDGSNHDDRF